MEFNARHGFVAGIDLGPTRTRLSVADLRGEPLAHRLVPTPVGIAPEAVLSRMAAAVRALMAEGGAPPERLLAGGAARPAAGRARRAEWRTCWRRPRRPIAPPARPWTRRRASSASPWPTWARWWIRR